MTSINLRGLETLLGAPGPISRGLVEATYWAGNAPVTVVTGADVVFPPPIRVDIVDGVPVESLDLVPTGGVCCVRWLVRSFNGGPRVIRFTSVPDDGPVDFGDLPIVDPATFLPLDPVPPSAHPQGEPRHLEHGHLGEVDRPADFTHRERGGRHHG